MRRPNPVVTTATLRRRTGERTWEATLPNGKEIIAHVPTWRIERTGILHEGQQVRVELTTYDFSVGRIAEL
jgi:translation initiation factor IF-1